MDMKKGHAEEHENDERWLLTYADLITLLMVFFVVMYAMSRTDAEKFKALASGLSQVFGKPAVSSVGIGGQPVRGNAILPNKAEGDSRSGTRNKASGDSDVRMRRIRALKSDLDALMENRGLSKSVTTRVDPRGPKLVMELSDSLLFEPGSADLTPDALLLLEPVAQALGARDYNVHVEGHTDNVPISNGRFRNNFELSTARAVNVIMNLINKGGLPAQRFSASGYGEYRPVAGNDTPEGRAKNRRVDFVIYDENALDSMLGIDDTMSAETETAAGDVESATATAPAHEPESAATTRDSPTPDTAAPVTDLGAAGEAPQDAHPSTPEDTHAPADAHAAAPAHNVGTTAPILDAVTTHVNDDASQSLSHVLALPKPSSASAY